MTAAFRYLSVCSGIEAATVAWRPLGWEAAAFAEIEPFPSAVLAHHYPGVPNVGDFTKIEGDEFGTVDLLVGGTPCQPFSVAGRREGLADERGSLTLEYIRLAGRMRPRWLVWENVPGILSHDGGRTFGTVLGRLAQLGYGFAYRILDAQYFGVPQRRRRVFLVGYLGNWRAAAAVLFERHSLSGDTAPRRKAGKEIAGSLTARFGKNGGGANGDLNGGRVIPAVTAGPPFSRTGNAKVETEALVFGGENCSGAINVTPALTRGGRNQFESEAVVVAGTLRGNGFDASEDGTGRQTIIPMAFHGSQDPDVSGDVTHPVGRNQGQETCVMDFTERGRKEGRTLESQPDLAYALTNPGSGGRTHSRQILDASSAVRRLTTRECERLQGFKDDYTLISYRGKPAADGPRYKSIGNSMAVPVMRWLGKRIKIVETIMAAENRKKG